MSDGNGRLPTGWAPAALGDLGEWKGGGTPRKSNAAFWTNGKVPWVSPKDMKRFYLDDAEDLITENAVENSSAQLIPKDSVLVVTRSGILQRTLPVAINRVPVATNQDLKTLIPIRGIDSRYVAYLLKANDQYLRAECSKAGTTVASIDLPKLKAYRVCLAPEPEQRRIVSAIESLQARSSRARAELSEVGPLLAQFRQSVLRAAFCGRLTADWRAANPDVEPASELLARIRTQRRHRWEHSELAKYEAKGKKLPKGWKDKYKGPEPVDESDLEELPDGWCWCRVKDIGNVQLGRQRAPKYHSGENMRPYLRVMNVYEDRIDIQDVMEMEFSADDYERYRLVDGDILLNEGQSFELVGRPAVYRNEIPGACFTNTLVRFRADNPITFEYPQIVFLAYLKTERFQRIASRTVNIAHLGAGRFADMEFPLPPLMEQTEVVRKARTALNQINHLETILASSKSELKQLDQSILAKAFRGELVPQDPSDEPASELLARIRAAREVNAAMKKSGAKPRSSAGA